jgi:hypothetical protein
MRHARRKEHPLASRGCAQAPVQAQNAIQPAQQRNSWGRARPLDVPRNGLATPRVPLAPPAHLQV